MNFAILNQYSKRLIANYRDREFYESLFHLALPIILQNFIASSLSLVSVMMIGQMGETSVAAVGLANQVFFLLNLFYFGVNSGAAIFTAQFWGVKDVKAIRKVLGLALILTMSGSLIFFLASFLAPQAIIGVYSQDPAVVATGAGFLKIFALSFLFSAVSFSYAAVLRSVGDVRTPLYVSIAALSLNALLSYLLIFGKLGLPAMGVRGAAIATVVARGIECASILGLTYLRRTPSPAAARISELFSFNLSFSRSILGKILPVTGNEVLWSVGITMYNVVYAHISTDSIAAMNIALTIDNLALVFFIGIANACAILVGNWIGRGDEQKAYKLAFQTVTLSILGAVLMGILIAAGSGLILQFYKVAPLVIEYARAILYVIAIMLWVRMINMILFVGVFRSGGDTRYAFILDVGSIWVVGVPMAFLGAFVLHLPIYLVYLMALSEEAIKSILGMRRFLTRKWINNLTYLAAAPENPPP